LGKGIETMKKYTRISCSFTSTGITSGLNEDAIVNNELNNKLQEFIKENKVRDYRIINTETVIVPAQTFSSAYNLVCLHLEYEV
jgi:hypothetical protein